MPSLELTWQWAVAKCNDPNVGYSMTYRNQRTVNGITYYDCSSFIFYGLEAGRFDVAGAFGHTYPFTTEGMDSTLRALDFTRYNSADIPASQWQECDILWRRKRSANGTNHTEFVHSPGYAMGARGAKNYTLPNQVAIHASAPADWDYLYRYQGPNVSEWIKGNRYLSQSEMENNAVIIRNFFNDRNYSLEAICGILGNIQQESTVNPGLWQNFQQGSTTLGFGLVQWTPSTKYTNWANANGYAIDDGDWQLTWIHELTVPTGQWIPTPQYNMSWSEFIHSTETPEYLASAFLKNFERARDEEEANRRTYARNWYNYLSGIAPVPPSPHPVRLLRRNAQLCFFLKPYDL